MFRFVVDGASVRLASVAGRNVVGPDPLHLLEPSGTGLAIVKTA
ncbi:hypothetical protein [Mesorhizobium sp.]|nr:hypothetical protein [Mesorhizobium sp.]